jgi:hypothetical protein
MQRSFTLVLSLALASLATPSGAADRAQSRLQGYAEVPSVATSAIGRFRATIREHDAAIDYELSYTGLEGDVRQAHIHLGQMSVNGGVMVFLCQTEFNPDPTGLAPTCVQDGTVTGTVTAANVIGPAGQGVDAAEFAELVRAIRAGVAYANVHTSKYASGEVRGQIALKNE